MPNPVILSTNAVLFDYLTRLLVVAERYKSRVAQVVAFGPIRKLDLSYQLWSQPLNLRHDCCRDRFAASCARRFGKICEWTFYGLELWKVLRNLASQRRCEPIPDLRDEDEVFAFVVADEQVIETIWTRLVTADDKLLTFVRLVLDPSATPLAGFVST